MLRKLVDSFNKNLRCLEALGEPVNNWDSLIIYLMLSKVDSEIRREWELSNNKSSDISKFSDLVKFLDYRCQVFESLHYDKVPIIKFHKQVPLRTDRITKSYAISNAMQCVLCKKRHLLFKCEDFKKLTVKERISRANQLNVCTNCLNTNHHIDNCPASFRCVVCHEKHNTLLHCEEPSKKPSNDAVPSTSFFSNEIKSHVLLSTAVISALNKNGAWVPARILLDSGSQSNFITQEFSKKLSLKTQPIKMSVSGISQSLSDVSHKTEVSVKSNINSYSSNISCLILKSITSHMPSVSFSTNILKIPRGIKLADRNFNISGRIDMLLGAGLFWSLLRKGFIKLPNTNTILQNTALGWIISGTIQSHDLTNKTFCNFSEISILNNNVEKFWELEKVENANCFSDCELECERHFVAHTNRNFDGRFVVRIPFKYNKIELGNSKQIALKRFALLEKRFKANTELFKEYKNFIVEYLKLGHMREVNEFREPTNAYYLPHHPVIKKESLTTKLRVVFDASCKTSNGRSLNDLQAVGPTIQKDIFSILLRFRRHKYALTADIEKMYRQVIIHKDDRKFQRIFWRDNSNDSIKCFELNTVTYGTASAPFLAIRCLEQLCKENYETYPIECEIIRKDFYVDDLITGADTLPQLKTIKQNL
ncbi:uncharacterized protein LOC113369864 [Ctenocephalides felis]|uniref:uncharacterized protein LOC113365571 n=1 Tax=Ctenocephalides felis TaxID=7515 RepID=UPI000E6E57B4|nr:uncharacterized protein LOC113365571 [Ctenocephalides felis]XP_026466282.1 uncharacterized protein LOC113369864 [Ctenocephalides felis]